MFIQFEKSYNASGIIFNITLIKKIEEAYRPKEDLGKKDSYVVFIKGKEDSKGVKEEIENGNFVLFGFYAGDDLVGFNNTEDAKEALEKLKALKIQVFKI